MLACFARGSGLDGRGAKRHRPRATRAEGHQSYLANPSPEEEGRVYAQLAEFRNRLPTRLQDGVEEVLLGAGANGIAYVDGPRVSVAFEGDIAVYFQGELRGDEMSDEFESFAHEILARYTAEQTVGGGVDLGLLSGQFALVVFDKLAGCVCAARDHRGAEPLFWGTRDLGETLVFGSDAASVASRCGDADAFPAGTMFVSQCGDITGELTMLEEPEDEEDEDEEAEGYRRDGSAVRAPGSRPGFEGTETPVRVLPTDAIDDVGGSASDSDEGRTTATATMVAAFAGDEERRYGGMLDAEGEADEEFDDWVTTRGAGARASLMSRCERSFRDALEMESRSESEASLRDLARGPERDPVVPSAA